MSAGTTGKVWANCSGKGQDVLLATSRRKPVKDARCPDCGKTVAVYDVRLVSGEYVGKLRQHGRLVDAEIPKPRASGRSRRLANA